MPIDSETSDDSRIRLEKRPSDFSYRPSRSTLSTGCTTCCTCCLHWLGAVVGTVQGLRAVASSDSKSRVSRSVDRPDLPLGIYVFSLAAAFAVIAMRWGLQQSQGEPHSDFFLLLLFVPNLLTVPAGLAAIFVAVERQYVRGEIGARPNGMNGSTIKTSEMSLVERTYRLAWMVVWISMAWTAAGYLVMAAVMLIWR